MQILHLDIQPISDQGVELRCFGDNPNNYASRTVALADIATLVQDAEENYYAAAQFSSGPKQAIVLKPYPATSRKTVDLVQVGQQLFQWLDGPERWLVSQLNQSISESVVLAISLTGRLAHLPWEVLHDGTQFLVQRPLPVVPVRWQSGNGIARLQSRAKPQNRALNLLFMATSPRNVLPVLDYEREEAQILKATERPTISLTVEESGCLDELAELIRAQGQGFFDVVHLTGHADLREDQPRFITETLTGDAVEVRAAEIAKALGQPLPALVFLSGCRTGQAANAGAVPSMAEALLQYGATAVLGWGQPVLDTNATAAAAALYGALARSEDLITALAETYQTLIQQQAPHWHLLRLYVGAVLPGALVMPRHTPGWRPAPKPSVATEFLDPLTKQVKVPTRENFVGRRRHLQNCLRALTQTSEALGVLIHGMGGLGKSSLAARLCDRLTHYRRVVWMGPIDPAKLVRKLAEELDDAALRELLLSNQEDLQYRLRAVFQAPGAKPFLLVLDDFEQNLTARGVGWVVNAPALAVLDALVWAIQRSEVRHRLILTCRYEFDWVQAAVLVKQPLDSLQGADLQKKCSRLAGFGAAAGEDAVEELKQKTLQLADGNPRLLEDLDQRLWVNPGMDRAAVLEGLAGDPTELRKAVVSAEALQQMEALGLNRELARGLVFELPVPWSAFAVVGERQRLDRAVALGLLEVSPEATVRVPRILPLALPQDQTFYTSAAQALYQCWWHGDEPIAEEQALELVRLGLLAQEQEIAVTVGDPMATRWVNSSRYQEARALCLWILQQFEDYRILLTIGRAEKVLGYPEDAKIHYQQALNLCPETDISVKSGLLYNTAELSAAQGEIERAMELWAQSLELLERINDVQGKAATLGNMARVIAAQGEIERAMELWAQSLELYERINDVQGKAATLNNMAGVIAAQGEIERAMELWAQSLELYERINDVQGKAATLNNMAGVIADQGDIERAMELWAQSLELYERINDVQGKAAMLNNMARVIADQGDIERAMELWAQSLELKERINDVQGKAATLNNMARVIAAQGDIERAMELWAESLEILERINDVQGKAVTLNNMSHIAFQQGEVSKAVELLKDCAIALGQSRAFVDLFIVLSNLGVADPNDSPAYRAQALWLGLRTQPPLTDLVNLLQAFYNQVPQGDALECLLATTAVFVCQTRGQSHPQLESLQNTSLNMLANAATVQGAEIQSLDDLITWMQAQQLNDPEIFLPQLIQRLESLIGDTWLFDPSFFQS